MLLSLLSCALLSGPAPAQPITVPLPAAQHAGSVGAAQVLWPVRRDDGPDTLDGEQALAVCGWLRGEPVDAGLASALLRRGELDFAVLEIDASSVRFAGEVLVELSGGRVPDDLLRGQLITPVYDALIERVGDYRAIRSLCGPLAVHQTQDTAVLLAIAPSVPFQTAREVLYTAGQSQVGTFHLVIDGPGGEPAPTGAPPASDRQVSVLFEDGGRTFVRQDARIEAQTGPLAPHLPALLDGGPLGCSIVVPQSKTAWSEVIATFDELSAAGASRYVIAGGVGDSSAALDPVPPAAAATTLSLTLDTVVPVFTTRLPAIGLLGEEEPPECAMQVIVPKPTSSLGVLEGGIGGLIGAKGTQIGSSGLGGSGSLPASPAASAQATRGEPIIDGPLRPEQIDAVISRHMNQIRYCYQRRLHADPDLSGSATVRFVVEPDGSVSTSEVTEDTLSDSAVASCVAGRFLRFRFPEPADGQATTVTQPFSFSPD